MTLMTGTSSAQISTPSVTRVSKDLIMDKPSSLSIEIIEISRIKMKLHVACLEVKVDFNLLWSEIINFRISNNVQWTEHSHKK